MLQKKTITLLPSYLVRCNSILKGAQGISLLLQSCSFQTNKQTCNNICAAIDSSLSHVHIKNVYLLSHNALQCYQNLYEFAIDFFIRKLFFSSHKYFLKLSKIRVQGPRQDFGTASAKIASNLFSTLRWTKFVYNYEY